MYRKTFPAVLAAALLASTAPLTSHANQLAQENRSERAPDLQQVQRDWSKASRTLMHYGVAQRHEALARGKKLLDEMDRRLDVLEAQTQSNWSELRRVAREQRREAPRELVQLEHWGCPWSRRPDGHANVRAFGGMKIERTWFAADMTGFHMLHTLFQTSMKYPSIRRFDEHFCLDLLVEAGRAQGVVAIEVATGEFRAIRAKAVVIATGGAGRVFRQNTNGGIVTGDGMALAYRHGVPLRDMEFMQYHPTGMPGTGLLFTEACRGEGGLLLNKDGYRYLQDYGLGPPDPWPRKKAMELGPRDRLSQAFWHEQRKGRTIKTAQGDDCVNLDLRHLGRAKLRERLPKICELADEFLGIDTADAPIPVRPDAQ